MKTIKVRLTWVSNLLARVEERGVGKREGWIERAGGREEERERGGERDHTATQLQHEIHHWFYVMLGLLSQTLIWLWLPDLLLSTGGTLQQILHSSQYYFHFLEMVILTGLSTHPVVMNNKWGESWKHLGHSLGHSEKQVSLEEPGNSHGLDLRSANQMSHPWGTLPNHVCVMVRLQFLLSQNGLYWGWSWCFFLWHAVVTIIRLSLLHPSFPLLWSPYVCAIWSSLLSSTVSLHCSLELFSSLLLWLSHR